MEGSAWLYHDQLLKGKVTHWSKVHRRDLKVKFSDVITVVSKGTPRFHGIVASIKIAFAGRRRQVMFTTGRSGQHKAVAWKKANKHDRKF